MKVAVVTDSTSDIPKEIAKKYGITIVPLNVHFDLDTYQDGINITSEEFYKKLVSGKIFPTTSAPSSGIFLETYKKLSENYDAIISIHVSSKTSATYNSALQASKEIKIPIEVIDSKVVSAALALIVIKIASYVKSSTNLKNIKTLADTCTGGYMKFGIYRHRTIGYWNSDWESLQDQRVYLDSIVFRKPKKEEKFKNN